MTPRETITQHNRDTVSLSQYGDALVGMTLRNDPVAMYDFDLMVAYFKNPDWASGDGRDGGTRVQHRQLRVPSRSRLSHRSSKGRSRTV